VIIGFGHKARQGKNTAALALLEASPIDSGGRLCAFAGALRAEVRKAIILYGSASTLIKEWKRAGVMPEWITPEVGKQRSLYQWWGTDFRRAQDANYWIKKFDAAVKNSGIEMPLVTDVRFPNEAEYVRSNGGILVKVTNTSKPDFDVHEHPSEQALDGYAGWHYELRAASVAELQAKARALYEKIRRAA